MNTVNILLAGVGGQGILLAGELLCLSFIEMGFDVKMSEIHGMAQRGGTVTSHVRYGEKITSPLISKGEADILLAFEALEALRSLDFLKPEGRLIVNRQEIMPLTVTTGKSRYPDNIYKLLMRKHPRIQVVDALGLARKTGNTRTVNSVLLGAVSRELNIPDEILKNVISQRLPERYVFMNLRALELGKNTLSLQKENIYTQNSDDISSGSHNRDLGAKISPVNVLSRINEKDWKNS